MQKINRIYLFCLIFCLVFVWVILQYQPKPLKVNRTITLQEKLKNIQGWLNHQPYEIDEKIVQALFLDEYFNQSFSHDNQIVSLYIGYYQTAGKVGAAHDPMVCFPGQGWILSKKSTGIINFDEPGIKPVSYSMMIAAQGDSEQLVLYWFQAYDKANADTLSQKITTLWNRIQGQGEDNAFVRIIIPMDDRSIEENRKIILNFVQSFYPSFLDYITQPS